MTITIVLTMTMTMTMTLFTAVPAAAQQQSVVINEIAWMGTDDNYRDEWIELFNTGTTDVPLDGWVLQGQDANDDVPWTISLSGIVPAGGFVVVRQKFGDYLNNFPEGENVLLVASGNTVDSINALSGWPAGTNTKPKKTMERTADGSWATSSVDGGTPGAQNSVISQTTSGSDSTTQTPPPQEEETALPPPPSQTATEPAPQKDFSATTVQFSEFLPDPVGRDDEGEFIELFNFGAAPADLSSWFLDDVDGNTTKPWKIPEGTTLAAGAYRAFFYTQTKITLNNKDGDTVRLLDPTGRQHDAVRYAEATEGWALARFDGAWEWTREPTPGAQNARMATTMINDNDDDSVTAPVAAVDAPKAPQTKTSTTTAKKTSATKTSTAKTSGTVQAPALPQGTAPSTPDENEQRDSQLLSASAHQSTSPLKAQLPLLAAIALAVLSGVGFVLFRMRE